MNPTLKTKLETVAGVGLLTFLAAFFGALSSGSFPLTLDAWKPIVATALAGAVAAELVYLRGQVSTLLSGTPLAPIVAELGTVAAPFEPQLAGALERVLVAHGVPAPALASAVPLVTAAVQAAGAPSTLTAAVVAAEKKL